VRRHPTAKTCPFGHVLAVGREGQGGEVARHEERALGGTFFLSDVWG